MSADELQELKRRLNRLESVEAIKVLKARYLNACDQQDPEAVRNCFAEGEVPIDMSYFGVLKNRDEFVDIFKERGCHDHVLDMHHGVNPVIEIIEDDYAKGLWSLNYRNINTQDNTLTMISALYHDEYRKIDGHWKVCKSRTEYCTALNCNYQPGTLEVQMAARTLMG